MAGKRIKYVALDDVELVSHQLASEQLGFDEPIPPFETRNPGVLESCLETPLQAYQGKDMYIGLAGKASILLYLMVKNHPFQNGNKRVAVVTLLMLLYKNGKWIYISNKAIYDFAVSVAESHPKNMDRTVKKINTFINKHMTDSGDEKPSGSSISS